MDQHCVVHGEKVEKGTLNDLVIDEVSKTKWKELTRYEVLKNIWNEVWAMSNSYMVSKIIVIVGVGYDKLFKIACKR